MRVEKKRDNNARKQTREVDNVCRIITSLMATMLLKKTLHESVLIEDNG